MNEPKLPYKEMSNSQKLKELDRLARESFVFRTTLAQQEFELAETRENLRTAEAQVTRISRMIHANACLQVASPLIEHALELDAGIDLVGEVVPDIVNVGMALGEAINAAMKAVPDSDDALLSDEPPADEE